MTVPKKPVAVSRVMKKLPLELDWGKGIPKDRLRYINAREEALIKANRSSTADRSHMGVKAYADDSASSKGVSRGPSSGTTTTKSSSGGGKSTGQGGQGRGPSGAGQGPNSASSGSRSPSAGSKSPSGGQGGSKSPNAAAQAASNRMNGISGASRPAIGGSRSPNMAAGYASQKLNATAGALKTDQNPRTVSGMLNSKVPQSASGAEGLVQRDWFNNQLGSLYNDPAINKNLPSALREGMWNQRISDSVKFAQNPNYDGSFGERTLAPWDDAGFRTKAEAAANAARGKGIKASYHNYGLAADIVTPGMPGYNDPNYKSWENKFARANEDLAANIPDNYGVKWGGTFKSVDPAHFQVGSGSRANSIKEYGTAVQREGIRPDGVSGPTASYGNGSTNPFTGTGLAAANNPQQPPKSDLQRALDNWNPPKYTDIPAPTGMIGDQYSRFSDAGVRRPVNDPNAVVSGPLSPPVRDPAAARMAGAVPASPTMSPSNPFGAVNPVAAGRLASLQTRLSVDDALSAGSTPPVPTARPPSQNMQPPQGWTAPQAQAGLPSSLPGFTPQGLPNNFRGTAGMAYNYTGVASPGPSVTADNTDSYNPQAGPGEQDVPYSDSPVQGSQNPMQEGPAVEDPGIRKARQQKYASTGATVGSVIAGPIGAVIGGTLGWQMGKTTPGQRRAIASNPKAIAANVQSINTMVEERGGKGNPDMHVTGAGFRDVLTNPANVTANPQQYTSLEQMLAQLAQGIDPETGKKL